MDESPAPEPETAAAVHGQMLEAWQLPAEASPDSWAALREALAARIAEWMERDFARLLNAMYTVDIPEKRFQRALGEPAPAHAVADLVLQRELEKYRSRQRYAKRRLDSD